jgi:hypothetical protein
VQDAAGPSISELALNEPAPPLLGGWLGQQLQRLQRLLALRDAHATHLNDEGRRLLDHAIFTTFVDCRELGGEQLASSLLISPEGGGEETGARTATDREPDVPIE